MPMPVRQTLKTYLGQHPMAKAMVAHAAQAMSGHPQGVLGRVLGRVLPPAPMARAYGVRLWTGYQFSTGNAQLGIDVLLGRDMSASREVMRQMQAAALSVMPQGEEGFYALVARDLSSSDLHPVLASEAELLTQNPVPTMVTYVRGKSYARDHFIDDRFFQWNQYPMPVDESTNPDFFHAVTARGKSAYATPAQLGLPEIGQDVLVTACVSLWLWDLTQPPLAARLASDAWIVLAQFDEEMRTHVGDYPSQEMLRPTEFVAHFAPNP